MFRARQWLFYLLVLGLGATCVVIFMQRGALLESTGQVVHAVSEGSYWQQFKTTYQENLTHPLAKLLLMARTGLLSRS